MAEPLPLRALGTPLAHELAEYLLIRQDLVESFETMRLWFDRYASCDEPSADDSFTGVSLFKNSVVTFVSCFDGSTPVYLSARKIFEQIEGAHEAFKNFKDIRDAYVAHRFGPHRQCVVGILLDSTGEIMGSGELLSNHYGFPPESRGQILSFMAIPLQYVDHIIARLKTEMKASASSMTILERLALNNARVYGVSSEQVKMPRGKFQRIMR